VVPTPIKYGLNQGRQSSAPYFWPVSQEVSEAQSAPLDKPRKAQHHKDRADVDNGHPARAMPTVPRISDPKRLRADGKEALEETSSWPRPTTPAARIP
jgi:hypothetical protein